jgi:hypothetical protein
MKLLTAKELAAELAVSKRTVMGWLQPKLPAGMVMTF